MERDEQPRPAEGREEAGYQGAGGEPSGNLPPLPPAPGDPVAPGGQEVRPAPPPVAWTPEPADDEDDDSRTTRATRDPSAIRAEDTEPYIGLQYVARLFKVVAMVVIVALTAEVVAALVMEGPDALLPLFLELLQGAVLAALLWGASDLTLLFIDVGHDVRAARVLLGRMSARVGQPAGYEPERPERPARRPRGPGEEYVG